MTEIKRFLGAILTVILFFGIAAQAVEYQMPTYMIGYPAHHNPDTTTESALGINVTAERMAVTFIAPSGGTLSEISIMLDTVTGTLGQGEIQCGLHTVAANGDPVEANPVGTSTTFTPSSATSDTWHRFTFASGTVVKNTKYAINCKNLDASPGSNHFTFNYWPTGSLGPFLSTMGTYPNHVYFSNDSGGTWSGSAESAIAGWRVKLSNGTAFGVPIEEVFNTTSAGKVHASNESGNVFTSPPVGIKVRGVAFITQKAGTPTGNLRMRIYKGTKLLGTTSTALIQGSSSVSVAAYNWSTHWFDTPITIPASTPNTRVVFAETSQSDDNTNYYYTYVDAWDSDATSQTLLPFSNMQLTYYNGTSWSNTANRVAPMMLILDNTAPFDASNKQVSSTITLEAEILETTTDTIFIDTHGLLTGDKVKWSSTDTVPEPFVAGVNYYVYKVDADNVKLMAGRGDALAGTNAITLTSAGAGTVTLTKQDAGGGGFF